MKTLTNNEPLITWEPDIDKLPEIVRSQMDQWLTHYEKYMRRKAIHHALSQLVEWGQAEEVTSILRLQGRAKGEIIEKEFTFFKVKPEATFQRPRDKFKSKR